jgi:hypothetical protein
MLVMFNLNSIISQPSPLAFFDTSRGVNNLVLPDVIPIGFGAGVGAGVGAGFGAGVGAGVALGEQAANTGMRMIVNINPLNISLLTSAHFYLSS